MRRFYTRRGELERGRALSEIGELLSTINWERWHAGEPALNAEPESVLSFILAAYQGRHGGAKAARAVARWRALGEYIDAAELTRGLVNRHPNDKLPACLSPSSRGKLKNGTLVDLLNAEMERAVGLVAEAVGQKRIKP